MKTPVQRSLLDAQSLYVNRSMGSGFSYLGRDGQNGVPLQAWKDILQEGGVVLEFPLLQLGVLEVEWKRSGRGFTRFDRAGKEVHGE